MSSRSRSLFRTAECSARRSARRPLVGPGDYEGRVLSPSRAPASSLVCSTWFVALWLAVPAAWAHDPAHAPGADPPRVARARADHAPALRARFAELGLAYPPRAVLLRVYKLDDVVEVWVRGGGRYVKLEDLPICARSGGPGPKRREGDGQVPEGFYRIPTLNPTSNFFLSMQVDYPNAADRRRPRPAGGAKLGGEIFVHGACATIGCVPLGDAAIGRLYVLAADVRAAGGRLDAHLFPTAMDAAHAGARADAAGDDAWLTRFWDEELAPGWAWFERERTLPPVEVDAAGRYVLRGRRSH
jgi:hypothetical protein